MNKVKFIILAFIFSLIGNCVSLHSIAINSQPDKTERVNLISAETSKLIFLAFNFDNNFLEDTSNSLKEKCPDGKIKGIITKFETVSYFIVYKYVVSAKGYCVK